VFSLKDSSREPFSATKFNKEINLGNFFDIFFEKNETGDFFPQNFAFFQHFLM